jgi:hypothetical protein
MRAKMRAALWVAPLGCLMAGAGLASAQSLPVVSHPVVQPLPTPGSTAQHAANDPARQLSNALGRLAATRRCRGAGRCG